MSPEEHLNVQKLIEEEMVRMPRADYLKDILDFSKDVFINKEKASVESNRIELGEKLSAIDITRYQLSPPDASQKTDVEAWINAVDNAGAQMEHQSTRLLNLELLQKYGVHAWKLHLQQLQQLRNALQLQLDGKQTLLRELRNVGVD